MTWWKVATSHQYVYLFRSVFKVRRQCMRPCLAIISVALLVIFILKLQTHTHNVLYSLDAMTNIVSRWTRLHDSPVESRADLDKARAPRVGSRADWDNARARSVESRADLDNARAHSVESRADLDNARARRHFAQFGVDLVKVIHANDGSRGTTREHVSRQQKWWFRKQEYHNPRGFFSLVTSLPSLDGSKNILLPVATFQPIADSSQPPLQESEALTTTEKTPSDVVLTVLVISRPNNVRLRQAARQTWGQSSRHLGVELRFVVGRQENWDDIVERETRIHNDVIVVEQEDTYENLPSKVLRGFSWLLRQPISTRYIMKIDDDTIVNLPYLLQELHSGGLKSTQIMGAICINSTVIRDPKDKWSVSLLDYPFSTYPPYAFGGGYVMSAAAAASVVKASSISNEWIHLEDVYITGILAMKCKLSHVTQPAFSYWMTSKASACDLVMNKRMTSVNHSENEFYRLYSDTQLLLRTRNTTSCTK